MRVRFRLAVPLSLAALLLLALIAAMIAQYPQAGGAAGEVAETPTALAEQPEPGPAKI